MDAEQMEAARTLIDFARTVSYNDSRFAPKDMNAAADMLEGYLDQD